MHTLLTYYPVSAFGQYLIQGVIRKMVCIHIFNISITYLIKHIKDKFYALHKFNEDANNAFELRQTFLWRMDHGLKLYLNLKWKKIRRLSSGVWSVSALYIDISPAESLSAQEVDNGVIKLAVSHVQKPCEWYLISYIHSFFSNIMAMQLLHTFFFFVLTFDASIGMT